MINMTAASRRRRSIRLGSCGFAAAEAWLACIVLVLASTARCGLIRVDWSGGGDYATLQEGIGAASYGDTVLVAPGTYSGPMNRNLDFVRRNLTLISESGSSETIIDCEQAGRALALHRGQTVATLIQGFTIKNGLVLPDTSDVFNGYGGGIFCSGVSVRFNDIVFLDNAVANLPASDRWGGGLYVYYGAVSLTDCRFEGNVGYCGAGLGSWNATVNLVNCRFERNAAGNWGGAIHIDRGTVVAQDVAFIENEAQMGGAINFRNPGASHSLTGCSFVRNTAVHWGGAVGSYGARPVFVGCSFLENHSGYFGSAVSISGGSPGRIERSTFWQNVADHDGGVVTCSGASPTILDCTFISNSCYLGGVVYCPAGSSPLITNSIIAFTTAGLPVYCTGATSLPVTSYCCVYANAEGDSICGSSHDILFENPLFCGGPAPDWSLQDCSPCIGSGQGGTTIGAGEAGCVCGDPTGVEGASPGVVLSGCMPNPAREGVLLEFEVAQAPSLVSATIYTPAGKLVRRLETWMTGSGHGALWWDGRDAEGTRAASGVYLVEVSYGSCTDRGRMVILR
jgi:hypothetical protein